MKRIAPLCAACLCALVVTLNAQAGQSPPTDPRSFYTPDAPSTQVIPCGQAVNVVAVERSSLPDEYTYEARFYASGNGRVQFVTPGDSAFVELPGDGVQHPYTLTVHRAPNGPTPLTLIATGPPCTSTRSNQPLTIIAPTLYVGP